MTSLVFHFDGFGPVPLYNFPTWAIHLNFRLDGALGDASSPHGSNCLQFIGNSVSGDGSKSSSPSLPAAAANDGLSRQQLDLISQIMQQTKPNVSLTSTHLQNGQKSIPRPRTWNIQVSVWNKQFTIAFTHPHTHTCVVCYFAFSKESSLACQVDK